MGLPDTARIEEVEARLAELLTKEEELEALKGQWEAREKAELEVSQWRALYKSEDWLGCWIGLGIILVAIIYYNLTGLSFKAPTFRWTTEVEFQRHIAAYAPVVDVFLKQIAAKGETALEAPALALQKAIAAQDRKAVGAAAKKLEEVAKQVKDKDLKDKTQNLAKDLSGPAGQYLSRVLSWDNIRYSIYVFIAYLIIGAIGMALMGEPVGFLSWVSRLSFLSPGYPCSWQVITPFTKWGWSMSFSVCSWGCC